MKIKVKCASITEIPCDLLVVNEFIGVKQPGGATGAVDKALKGLLSELTKSGEISGKLGSVPVINTGGRIAAKHVAVAGLGESKQFDFDRVRTVSAAVVKKAKEIKAKTVATIVHGAGSGWLDPKDAAKALVEGAVMGNYEYSEFKTKSDNGFEIDELLVVDYDPKKVKEIEKGKDAGEVIATAVNRARDLVNGPSNKVTPAYFAQYAEKLAKDAGLLIDVLEASDMKKIGMDSMLAVAKGSREPAKMVVLKYKAKGKEVLGLVGKGITFDAGGISIKPSKGLSEMKTDMAGAAAVLEVMGILGKLGVERSVIAVIPLTENMPSGGALKPGDIVGSLEGKNIEIISTDAEGRMILSDALTYIRKLGATKIIDLATLTGGCRTALGDVASGIFGSDQEFIDEVISAAKSAGEKLWQLPMYEEYKEYLKSDVADMKNCTENGKASPSVGAIYLREFTGGLPWVHIDIAPTAYLEREINYLNKGATGVGVRTLAEYLAK